MTDRGDRLAFGPISAAAPGPLYEQVVAGVKREVARGRLRAGDPLPSLRLLAADLLVSVITVKRAYDDLERDGVIFSRPGLGAFVAPAGVEAVLNERAAAARTALAQAIEAGRSAGLTDHELKSLLEAELARGK